MTILQVHLTHGQVKKDDDYTVAEDNWGQIRTSKNTSIDNTSNWGILDYLKNIYYILSGQTDKVNAEKTTRYITDSTGSIHQKFSFANDVLNNVNDLKDLYTNTQATQTVYLNTNNKYFSGQQIIIDLSWYAQYKNTGDNIICAFIYFAFLWHFFKRLPDIIRGAGAGSYSSAMLEDIDNGFRKGR